MYSKAIDHVKDSPILYNNRAITYIRFVNKNEMHLFLIGINAKFLSILKYLDWNCIRKQ